MEREFMQGLKLLRSWISRIVLRLGSIQSDEQSDQPPGARDHRTPTCTLVMMCCIMCRTWLPVLPDTNYAQVDTSFVESHTWQLTFREVDDKFSTQLVKTRYALVPVDVSKSLCSIEHLLSCSGQLNNARQGEVLCVRITFSCSHGVFQPTTLEKPTCQESCHAQCKLWRNQSRSHSLDLVHVLATCASCPLVVY